MENEVQNKQYKQYKKPIKNQIILSIIAMLFLATMVGCSNNKSDHQKKLSINGKTEQTLSSSSISSPSNGTNSSIDQQDLNEYFIFNIIDDGYSVSLKEMPQFTTIISIPNKYNRKPVLEIENEGFKNFNQITEIILPDSLLQIGDSAFYNCSSLTNIEIPKGVTSIGTRAFENCSSLTSVTFEAENQLKTINNYVFAGSGLTSIIIPSEVIEIKTGAFQDCRFLKNITFASNSKIEKFNDFTFANCATLTSIVIPSSVLSIGEYAFRWCYDLSIYCNVASKPSGWNEKWNSGDRIYSDRPVYWSGEWSYVNGIPTPNNN